MIPSHSSKHIHPVKTRTIKLDIVIAENIAAVPQTIMWFP